MNNKIQQEPQTYYQRNKEKVLKQQQDKRDRKYEGLIEGQDYICCKECGFRSSELATHIINKHDMTVSEYKNKYGVLTVKSQSSIDRVKGNKNPAYQHGGKYSAFSDKFIYADITDKEAVKSKAKLNRQLLNKDTTKLSYWLEKTDGDIQEAQSLLAKRQSTFSLDICVDKYGEEDGKQVWLDRQEKWQKVLLDKPQEEIDNINKKKSNALSYSNLWSNKSIKDGCFYLLDITNGYYKIGITSIGAKKRNIKNKNYNIILEVSSSINHCFQMEQLLKQVYFKDKIIQKSEKVQSFGWTETLKNVDIDTLTNKIYELYENEELTTKIFKNNFNLKHASAF